MSPPRPPSPPDGPPRGTNFSRRNAVTPLPPWPPTTRIFVRSMNTSQKKPNHKFKIPNSRFQIRKLSNSAANESLEIKMRAPLNRLRRGRRIHLRKTCQQFFYDEAAAVSA